MSFDHIRFVLVETSHAGNIGAAARAIKTMGFSQLSLVNPCRFSTYECYARASGANDVLDGAQVHESLAAAIADCAVVIGTSARSRSLDWPAVPLRQMADRCFSLPQREAKIAIVFGRERSGLDNEEVALCTSLLSIPSNPKFSSLNISAAVQVVAYELHCASLELTADAVQQGVADFAADDALATHSQVENFYQHLQNTMQQTGFFDPANPRLLLSRIRRLYNRSALRVSEVQLLRGFLASVEKSAKK